MKISSFKICVQLARQGMTKSDLAKQSGLLPQSVCAIIRRGTCEPRTIGKIAAALCIDVEEIIAKEDS